MIIQTVTIATTVTAVTVVTIATTVTAVVAVTVVTSPAIATSATPATTAATVIAVTHVNDFISQKIWFSVNENEDMKVNEIDTINSIVFSMCKLQKMNTIKYQHQK